MNKRLEMLENLVAKGHADSFAHYALALEYRKAGRSDEALSLFERLRQKDPDYLAMYLMAAQTLFERQQREAAKPWLEQGLSLAERKGDGKAQAELQALLDEIAN